MSKQHSPQTTNADILEGANYLAKIMEDKEKTVKFLNESLKIDPNNPNFIFETAKFLFQSYPDLAITALDMIEEAIDLDSKEAKFLKLKAEIEKSLGMPNAAEESLKKFAQLSNPALYDQTKQKERSDTIA